MKPYHCILKILGKCSNVGIEMSVMCNISCLFSKEFFAVKPLKHVGLSDMEELIHMKTHELGTKGYLNR